MKTKKIAAAGTLIGSLFAASATVTAISVTGTLDFRALVPGIADTLGLDGARVTLVVEPGPALDDDDSGSQADTTVLDGNLETRSLRITGGGTLDGEYQSTGGSTPWTQLQRDTGVDRILLGGGEFSLDGQGLILQLAGVSLEMPIGTFSGPGTGGEFGLPGTSGGLASGSPAVGGGGGTPGPVVVITDGEGNPIGSYTLTDPEADLGGGDNAGGSDPQDPSQLLAGLSPELTTTGQPGPGNDPGTTGGTQPGIASSAAQVPTPATWLLLLAGLAGIGSGIRRR